MPAYAEHTPAPANVTIVGTLQSALGCPGDWQPECSATYLTYDADDDVWQAAWSLPAGNYEYKATLNNDWAENYGRNATRDGQDIPLSLADSTTVKFYYDHKSHWVTDNQNSVIATVPGSYQSEIGCTMNWQPDCLRSWLQDLDEDGTYSFSTAAIPAGNYAAKVAINESWDENYGAGGVPGGPDIPFTVADGDLVTFEYRHDTKLLTITSGPPPGDNPDSVTIAGSFQSELGCTMDWEPECSVTHLTYDTGDDVWQGTWTIPGGSHEYKAALNGSWDENYGRNATRDGANIPLNLSSDTAVKFYYDHKTHWVTDNQNSVIATVPGSFQSEIGCSIDWQPDCLRSWLQDPDGDGIYSFVTTSIPVGEYEAKVAINESWDENYGAGGVPGGANIPFSIPANNMPVSFTYDPDSHILTIVVGAPLEPGDEELVRPLLQHPVQDEVFYFLLPDRFEDGDAGNNYGDDPGGNTTADILRHGYLPTNKGYYHGGDLQGLMDRLDYLDEMGVTAIWMAPIFENQPVQGDGTINGSSSAYHGYWITDFTQVDPHFGSNEELADLIAAAHARSIKVFFDIVANHTADVIDYAEGQYSYRNKENFPYRDADGNVFDDRDYVGTGTFPDLDPATSFPYTPIFRSPADETAKAPAWLNNPIYYHNRGDSTFAGESSLYGDFFGLDDLFTEHPVVVEGMIDIYKFWISEFGIDGFRIDTVKHVNTEFWQEFAPAIMAHAEAEGKDEFFMFGEVFDGNPAVLSYYTTVATLPSVLDFGLHGQSHSFAVNSNATDGLRDFFANDDYYTDADSNAYMLANFISNHDIGRIGRSLQQARPGASDAELVARSQLAHALMYFARGFPVVYYGDEQGFTGDGGDKDARENMFPSQVAEYNDNNLLGTSATTADSNFDADHPLYQALAEYAGVYQAHLALRRGTQIHRYSSNSAGIYAFSRIDREEKLEYVLAFNNAGEARQATFATYSPDTEFTAIYPAGGSTTTNATGQITVNVPALSFVIYQAGEAIPASATAPFVNFITPAAGSQVSGRVEVSVSLSGDKFTEVTFAVKVNDGEYQVIGTDGNAPYRVFYDVSDLPDGTTVTFKAIADDLSGNLSSATRSAVVSAPVGPGAGPTYAIIHYFREDGDYGDHTTGNFNDFWGLHLWGEAIDPSEVTDWPDPKPFLGEDEYGRFAWIKLADPSQPLNFIVHRGDTKDGTEADRFFDPGQNPEVWLKQGDPNHYTSQAAAQGYVTLRYQRQDGDYGIGTGDYWGLHLWSDGGANAIDPSEETDWLVPKPPDGVDDYGAFWHVQLNAADPAAPTKPVKFIVHTPGGDDTSPGGNREPGDDREFIPTETATVWLMEQDVNVYHQRGAAEKFIIIHYHRPAGDYGDPSSNNFEDFWGLHTWGDAVDPGWATPRKPDGQDIFGIFFKVPLTNNFQEIGYILHRGDEKDPGPDQFLNVNTYGHEVWQLQGADPENPYILPVLAQGTGSAGNIFEQRAYWVDEDTIAWVVANNAGLTYRLHYAAEGGLEATLNGITGGQAITLTTGSLSDEVKAKFPHLANLPALKISNADLSLVPDILKGQIAVSAANSEGVSVNATGLQIPGVLDDLYTYDGDLGIVWQGDGPSLYLWAPTAQSVTFHLFDDSDPATTSATAPMTWDADTGVWSIEGEADWYGQYYLYEVEVYVNSTRQVEHNLVTDPYSVSLAMNSTRSQIVDLSDPALRPAGWTGLDKPPLAAPEDIVIYELHVRDFSAFDATVPEAHRGTFKAFTYDNTNGMVHLQALAQSGLTHLHLLPIFDIATINENKAEWQEPDHDLLATYPPDSELQQAAVTAVADLDGFNWGYDPYHYNVPEGSYSTDPDGTARIVEFRELVQSLNEKGLRVVVDVVYNHTNSAGQGEKSVLDRIVPGYYHRLNDRGQVETSTCCSNTATEHNMMEKLMVDSVVLWATAYKVDAFRFDLMGHHMVSNMIAVREALDALTVAEHGVDGQSIYVYGEGWNFGEVASNARGVNATQLNLGGLGIGTFSDRLRDAVRGGGPFDSGEQLRRQGFANGLYYDPNSLDQGDQLATLLLHSDQIRVGLAGNLAGYQFIDRHGNLVTGAQVDYNNQPAGYTEDPQEVITYISKHDNQTLYDKNVYGAPVETSMADRVRIQNMGLSIVAFSQGVPFFHAGSDMLRSKSLDRDSYNSGDWFNRLDFTYQINNFGVGLPVAEKNQENWPIMQPLLANPALQPEPEHILHTADLFRELLQIRNSSRLFRLETAAEIQARLQFYNTGPSQLPGLIVMSLSDEVGVDLDFNYNRIVVLFNANDEGQTFSSAELAGRGFTLHPVQQNSVDDVVKQSTYTAAGGAFFVPGRTTAVFVEASSPQAKIDLLIDEVESLVASGSLNSGQGNSLIATLRAAQRSLDRGNETAAVNQLQAFINQVDGLVNGGVLTPEEGQSLTDKARIIIDQINE